MGTEYYLGIDVGATKTLLAVFSASGEIICESKFKTSPDYEQFKQDLARAIAKLDKFKISHCCCAVPGRLDFNRGIALAFGNEKWTNVPVRDDLSELIKEARFFFHNDAKLAGLSEALLVKTKFRRVLYVTLSTGIGGGVVQDGLIDPGFVNFEPGQMVFEHGGQTQKWEAFASGKALKTRYGKIAAEIDDPVIWQHYAELLALGFENLLATVQPDVVIIGGGVGAHFEKFQAYLEAELKKIINPMVPLPPLLKAQRPEEAVIYGCYDYIKQNI